MTAFARTQEKHRPLVSSPLLALGDPVFQVPAMPRWPIRRRPACSSRALFAVAARAGIEAGDLLLQYDKTPLKTLEDLLTLVKRGQPADLVFWRPDGRT